MGFIRGSAFVILSVLFFISLLVLNSVLVVSYSLDYKNIQSELVPVVKQVVENQINLTDLVDNHQYPLMQKFCANSSINYNFSAGNYSFNIPCSVISNGTSAVIGYGVDTVVHDSYYADYNCSFFDCFKQNTLPLFLVSKQSFDYWQSKVYLIALASLILLALMFLFIEKKSNLPLVAGSMVVLTALPFMKLDIFFSSLPRDYLKFLAIVFNQSYKVFIIMAAIGIVLIATGIIMKVFGVGFEISEFFSKFSRGGQKESDQKQASPQKTQPKQSTSISKSTKSSKKAK